MILKNKGQISLLMLLCILLFTPQAAFAGEEMTAYERLVTAVKETHSQGPFMLRGDEVTANIETVNGKTESSLRYYAINGYDLNASETLMQFESRVLNPVTGAFNRVASPERASFLITPNRVYIQSDKTDVAWEPQEITAIIPKFLSMGTLDQFFMLELLNSGRLHWYKDDLFHGTDVSIDGVPCQTVRVDISRSRFQALASELTKDITVLLGAAAKGMTESQLTLTQKFAQGMLSGLDAEAHYIFYIEKETGRIQRISANMDMANPYGSRVPGAESRVQTKSTITLYDFGQDITRVTP